jgi:hypothetical protein
MNAEEILARAFADHEADAPDADTVLAEVRTRLHRRRRTVPAVAAAATVAAIAIGASVLVGEQRQTPPPAAPATPSSTYLPPRVPSQPTPTPVDPLSTRPPAAAAQATVDIGTSWLPTGTATPTGLYYFYGRQEREYVVTDPGRPQLNIELRLWTGTALAPDQFLDAAPRDLTLGGRPAREWPGPGLYVVVLQVPGGRVAQVNVFSPGGRAADLVGTGRRIATSLRLDEATPIRPDFHPTYVPKGQVVRGVFVRPGDGTAWCLAAPHADPAGPGLVLVEENRKATDPTVGGSPVPGRPVRGHPTYLFTEQDRVSLWVDGLVHGRSLVVSDVGKRASAAELYKVAEGVR